MLLIRRYLARLPSSLQRSYCISQQERLLATFDFDKTIIDVDSYSAVSQLLAPEQRTDQLQALIQQASWIDYIQRVLQLLAEQQENQRLNATQIGHYVSQLPAVPGMVHLLRRLSEHANLEICVLSDANQYFIEQWLAAHGLSDVFAAIYTNPSQVQPDGSLLVEPYEQQTHCDQCPQNLCKGGVMSRLMTNPQTKYKQIIYVGDSCNDLCAIRCLRSNDIACIRRGEELHEKLAAHRDELSCLIMHWRDGYELEQQLFSNCFLDL